MTDTIQATAPDLRAIKQRQQQTWASGDFSVNVPSSIEP